MGGMAVRKCTERPRVEIIQLVAETVLITSLHQPTSQLVIMTVKIFQHRIDSVPRNCSKMFRVNVERAERKLIYNENVLFSFFVRIYCRFRWRKQQ